MLRYAQWTTSELSSRIPVICTYLIAIKVLILSFTRRFIGSDAEPPGSSEMRQGTLAPGFTAYWKATFNGRSTTDRKVS
jgi:hypothetical protein